MAKKKTLKKTGAAKKPKQIKINLPQNSYSAYVGENIFSDFAKWQKILPSKRAFLIYDQILIQAHKNVKNELLAAGWTVESIAVQAGESLKDIQSVWPLFQQLMDKKADRWSVIFALGGGSVGDAVGFVASTYMRGLSWVGVPTTLLAQVDSSLGGKTGINHPAGKNLVGSFHQPHLVLCDVNFLNTLSTREIISGFAEAVKYGIVYDKIFFQKCIDFWPQILKKDPQALQWVVEKSLYWKAKAVVGDEKDLRGVREVLNFGHTFGHAIEKATNYEFFQHGEAVLLGMKFAILLSTQKNHLSVQKAAQILNFLQDVPVPKIPESVRWPQLFAPILKDKKNKDAKLKFVLLKDLGRSVLDNSSTEKELQDCYHSFLQLEKERTSV
ncbi:MAG: 3-dehydroquinate synthase [Pseudobdellovibrionaceae bacterium]